MVLYDIKNATDKELKALIESGSNDNELFSAADSVRRRHYGDEVYLRGLIEFANYCKNDCYYCGIRKSNRQAVRYRLSKDEIMQCCSIGYDLGYRTFVLQGGEDPYYSDNRICEIVSEIHSFAKSYRRYIPNIRIAQSHFLSVKNPKKAISNIMTRAQGVICCGTKRRTTLIIKSCTQTV